MRKGRLSVLVWGLVLSCGLAGSRLGLAEQAGGAGTSKGFSINFSPVNSESLKIESYPWAEDIDKALELGYGHPMGPLKLTDLVGLDVRLAIAEYLHQELKQPHYEPPALLREKVAAGELGKKTGKGFYEWPTNK